MSPEAQRIAIAEACGWIINHEPPYAGMAWEPNTPTHGRTVHTTFFRSLPNYTEDLNAMHEAEKVLTEEKRELFARYLYKMPAFDVLKDTYEDIQFDAVFKLVHATAAQRAEAFLKTVGKWEEPAA